MRVGAALPVSSAVRRIEARRRIARVPVVLPDVRAGSGRSQPVGPDRALVLLALGSNGAIDRDRFWRRRVSTLRSEHLFCVRDHRGHGRCRQREQHGAHRLCARCALSRRRGRTIVYGNDPAWPAKVRVQRRLRAPRARRAGSSSWLMTECRLFTFYKPCDGGYRSAQRGWRYSAPSSFVPAMGESPCYPSRQPGDRPGEFRPIATSKVLPDQRSG